jgi:hypothetical protein
MVLLSPECAKPGCRRQIPRRFGLNLQCFDPASHITAIRNPKLVLLALPAMSVVEPSSVEAPP